MGASAQKKITLVSFPDRFETADIAQAAEKLNIPLEVIQMESMEDPESMLKDSSVLYWRAASLSRKFPNKIGRTTFLAQADRLLKVVNRMAVDAPHFIYKSVQQAHFQKYASSARAVHHIETYLAEDVAALEVHIAAGRLSYPLIAKPNFGSKGIGIELLRSSKDFAFFAEHKIKDYIFQNFIPNKGDYRVLVIGGVVHEVMKRTPTESSTKSYLNNISQGGSAERVPEGKTRTLLTKVGSTVAALFDYAVCGVDFIEDLEGNFYFMEINSVPEWKGLSTISKYPVAEHLVRALAAIGRVIPEDELFEAVHDHYIENLQYLSIGSQFHFLSRLYLWSREPEYASKLEDIRDEWWSVMDSIVSRIKRVYDGTFEQRVPTKSYRRSAYRKHPYIDLYNSFFFKCLFDRSVFGGDAFERLSIHIKKEHVKEMYHQLISDPESVFELSTPAVNFIYFCTLFYPEECPQISPERILAWGDEHHIANPDADTDARIYFYTHAIIGATEFYSKQISDEHRAVYTEMLRRVEYAIAQRYMHTSIDHKAEFIVCCRMLGYTSSIESVIRSEILSSRSPHGIYFQNTLNTIKNNFSRRSMHAVEHSNILSLLAFMKFKQPTYPTRPQGSAIDDQGTNT